MSIFNSDQEGYMDSLARMDPTTKCYCGWYPKGECTDCDPQYSCADKIAMKCSSCGNAPWYPGGPMTHIINCPEGNK